MAVGTYEITHEKIMESGRSLFLQNGYERTNLRELCKGAGITTGAFYRHFEDKEALFAALVDPAIKGLQEIYDAAGDKCFDFVSVENINQIWSVSIDTMAEFIRYIFKNFDAFKLLLRCSDGTKYVDFTDWMERCTCCIIRITPASLKRYYMTIPKKKRCNVRTPLQSFSRLAGVKRMAFDIPKAFFSARKIT